MPIDQTLPRTMRVYILPAVDLVALYPKQSRQQLQPQRHLQQAMGAQSQISPLQQQQEQQEQPRLWQIRRQYNLELTNMDGATLSFEDSWFPRFVPPDATTKTGAIFVPKERTKLSSLEVQMAMDDWVFELVLEEL